MSGPSKALQIAAKRLSRECGKLRFSHPVAVAYNPLEYAWQAHCAYLSMARHRPLVLFVGMNPGPFGMVQTGVPFGQVEAVRDYLGIDESVATITAPARVHAKRPVEGFSCRRSEVSGARVWSWARERFGDSRDLFAHAFIWNWCPLAFVGETGSNLTPDKLPRTGTMAINCAALERACDRGLADAIDALKPGNVVGFGAFAAKRAQRVVEALGPGAPSVHQVLHPSPASPAANRGWAQQVDRQLREAGISLAR